MKTIQGKDSIMKNNDGFTLIELVVAILIFAVGILGVIKLQTHSIANASFGMHLTNATNLANNRIERIRGLSLDHADLSLGAHAGGASTLQGVPYNTVWTVNTTGLGATAAARDVQVVVRWTEKGLNHQVTMNFIRSDL